MRDDTLSPPGYGPTVILIGGRMTVDDGSVLDSRQPVIGDPGSHVPHVSLATSLLWWITASSLVTQILDCAARNPFALVIGNRTVVELRQDGSLRRTALRSFLPGGTTTVELVRTSSREPLPDGYREGGIIGTPEQIGGTVGFKLGEPDARWRFLDGNDYYLTQAGPAIGAAVIVDVSEALTRGKPDLAVRFEDLERRRLYSNDIVLVMPHTHGTEACVRGYLNWLQAGRPPDERPPGATRSDVAWDPSAPPDPIRYTCPVPLRADFEVTGLVQDGEWRDPSTLEAARSLLQARYDLKICIWDLVSNPILRRTLLDSTAVSVAPTAAAEVPAAAAQRAEFRVAEIVAERENESEALEVVARHLKPLYEAGWTDDGGSGSLRRRVGEPVSRWPGQEPVPLIELHLVISKHESSVFVFFRMYNELELGSYLITRQEAFEQIAAPDAFILRPRDSASAVLWRAQGGWDDEVDWEHRAHSLAQRTDRWVEELKPLLDDCLRFLEERERSLDAQAEAARKREADVLAAQWDQDFAALEAFVAREGHARVPRDHIENETNLYHWWFRQMSEYRRGRLSDSQVERLEVLPGWSWTQLSAHWEKMFAELESFVAREGHARVPLGHKENGTSLGGWVSMQRSADKNGRLSASQKTRLEALRGWR